MVVIKDDTNIVNLTGELEDNLEFSHEIFGEKFFNTKIKINRLSDVYDILPMTVSERLIEELDFKNNKFVTVSGQLRSYNKNVGEKNKLILTVFVREIKPKEEENNIFSFEHTCIFITCFCIFCLVNAVQKFFVFRTDFFFRLNESNIKVPKRIFVQT